MYRLLIADDEESIREGIAGYLGSHCPRWQVVGLARDGQEALRMATDLLPDAVLTDITMPHMNGLEFLESLSDILPEAKLLVLSGYDQFEYAVQAMRLGVSDYLLKPLDTAKLLAVLDRFAVELDAQSLQWAQAETLRLHAQRNNELELQNYFGAALQGEPLPALSPANAIPADAPYNYCCVLCDGMDQHLLPLQQMLEQRLYGVARCLLLRVGTPLVQAIVFYLPGTAPEGMFLKLNHTLTSTAVASKRMLGQSARFFVGCIVDAPSKLELSYRQCLQARQYAFPEHTPPVTTYEDVLASQLLPCPHPPRQIMQDIPTAVRCGNRAAFAQNCQALFDWFVAEEIRDANYMRMCVLSLCYEILQINRPGASHMSTSYYEFTNFQAEVMASGSLEELRSCLENLSSLYWLRQENQRAARPTLTDRVDEVVQAHLSDVDFSLDDVAAALFISPNYLRQLFKQETGQTFTEYLTAQRMQRARILLGTPETRVADVAEQVGYADPRYFSVSFKKYYHMTPSEYRLSVLPESGDAT